MRAHVLEGIFELDLFGARDPILGNGGGSELLIQDDVRRGLNVTFTASASLSTPLKSLFRVRTILTALASLVSSLDVRTTFVTCNTTCDFKHWWARIRLDSLALSVWSASTNYALCHGKEKWHYQKRLSNPQRFRADVGAVVAPSS